jgi:transposase-like protein
MRRQKAELWTKWRGLLSEQGQSGQTVAAFCRDRGLRDSLFYDWKRRLREGEAAKFVEVKVKESKAQARPAPGHSTAI